MMYIELPVTIDWDILNELSGSRPASGLLHDRLRESVRSVIDVNDLGHVNGLFPQRGEGEIVIEIGPDLYRAEKLWDCHYNNLLKRLLAKRVARAVDSCLKAMGMGGVDDYSAALKQFPIDEGCPFLQEERPCRRSPMQVHQEDHGPGLCEADGGRMSDADYVNADGQDCPHCGASCTMVAEGPHETDGKLSTQTATCSECGKSVTDLYELRGYRAEDEEV